MDAINDIRAKSNLLPLIPSKILERTATQRAEQSAASGNVEPESDRLPTLINAGAFARFALSHETSAPSFRDAAAHIVNDTLSKSKLLHPSITHAGIGFAKRKGIVYITVDLARVIPALNPQKAYEIVRNKLDEKRILNSLELLSISKNLDAAAQSAAAAFMSGTASSDEVMAEAQAGMKHETFAFGKMTVSFQTASAPDEVVIPERAADPALGFTGIGLAQGNRPELEPGAIAAVIILAEPQTAHDAGRPVSNIPAPKAQLKSKIASNKPLTDQAWTATLTGNHSKAAKLFEAAYRKLKKPSLLYEAARAHARNDDFSDARKDMSAYANLVSGEARKKAVAMAEKLKKKESIFSESTDEQMSSEAKRFFVMGQMLFQQQQWDGAIDAFQQAYKFSATPEIVYNIGLAHYRAGRIGEALNFFGEYQRLTPAAADVDEARQLFEIGVELYQKGRFEAASKQFAMAYSFLPFPELVYNLGLCYKAMGDTQRAVRFLREYLENEPPEKEGDAVRKMIDEISAEKKK